VNAHAQVNKVASLMARLDWFRLLIRCILEVSLKFVSLLS